MNRLVTLSICVAALLAGAQARSANAAEPGIESSKALVAHGSGSARRTSVPRATGAGIGAMTRGLVTYYGVDFKGRRTASGEPFDPEAMTMAHNTLPFGTRVRVTNLRTRANVELRVNDRGPVGHLRIGDVSLAAARLLGMIRSGIIDAKLEVIDTAP